MAASSHRAACRLHCAAFLLVVAAVATVNAQAANSTSSASASQELAAYVAAVSNSPADATVAKDPSSSRSWPLEQPGLKGPEGICICTIHTWSSNACAAAVSRYCSITGASPDLCSAFEGAQDGTADVSGLSSVAVFLHQTCYPMDLPKDPNHCQCVQVR
jgi:hypothetical protein